MKAKIPRNTGDGDDFSKVSFIGANFPFYFSDYNEIFSFYKIAAFSI